MERLAAGFTLPEALRSDGDCLYFSDAAAGGVYRLQHGAVEVVVPKRRGVGGLAIHEGGGLVITGRDLVHVRDGQTRRVFAAEGALGLNDLVTEASGAVLVGSLRMDWREPSAGSPGEVYRVDPDGGHEVLAGDIPYPNGIGIDGQARLLYVADYVGQRVFEFELESGRVVGKRVLVEIPHGNPDGLAVDKEGGVWIATGPGGTVERYDRAGTLTEVLQPPTTFAVTLCFGGDEGRDLYLATATSSDREELAGSIHLARSPVPGVPVARARV
jgi:xylono-1,5-lactonase